MGNNNEQIKFQRKSQVVFSEIDNEYVLMSENNGEYYGFNAIASEIWQLLEKPIALNSIIDMLTQTFDVTSDDCKSDVLEFINKLIDKQLIIEVNV